MTDHSNKRRRVLQSLGVAGGSVLLAGCSGDSNGNGDGNDTTDGTDGTDGTTTDGSDGTDGVDNQVEEYDVSDPAQQDEVDPEGWQTDSAKEMDIQLLDTYDSSGDAAWDMDEHPHVYISSNGPGYAGQPSGLENTGTAIMDADTHEVVAARTYDLGFTPFENHGCGVSPDGEYIFIPTGDTSSSKMQGRIMQINAETLKLDRVYACQGFPHHIKSFERYDGKRMMLAYTFNWQLPSWGGAGSGHWTMDPENDFEVDGGVHGGGEPIQANPYLSFMHPDGRHLYIGCPPGQITDPDISHHQKGIWAVVDIETWSPVDYFFGGYDPIWVDFSADGKYAYLSDGGSDTIKKVDCEAGEVISYARSAVHGVYGVRLNKQEDKIYSVGKGEASHNMGRSLGLVNTNSMGEVNQWNYGCLRGDHALVNPWAPKELWVSCNGNSQETIWDMENDEKITDIEREGSSHNGAFVNYEDGGELLFDQNGWHGSAYEEHKSDLGVDEVIESHSGAR